MTVSEMATGHLGLNAASVSSEVGSRAAKFNSKVVSGKKTDREPRKSKSFPEISSGESEAASATQHLQFAGAFSLLCQSPADVQTNQPTAWILLGRRSRWSTAVWRDRSSSFDPEPDFCRPASIIWGEMFAAVGHTGSDDICSRQHVQVGFILVVYQETGGSLFLTVVHKTLVLMKSQ